MRNFFKENEPAIREYCEDTGLDFEKARKMPKSFNSNSAYVLYYDESLDKRLGLNDEIPMPIVLKITAVDVRLEFEQTEHTAKHLSLNGACVSSAADKIYLASRNYAPVRTDEDIAALAAAREAISAFIPDGTDVRSLPKSTFNKITKIINRCHPKLRRELWAFFYQSVNI
jgi:hypothetical protein